MKPRKISKEYDYPLLRILYMEAANLLILAEFSCLFVYPALWYS